MFRENAFVSEYDAGKFYGINQRMTLLLSRSQVTAQGTQVMTQVELGTAGACNARRSHVRSSTKLAPSRRVSDLLRGWGPPPNRPLPAVTAVTAEVSG